MRILITLAVALIAANHVALVQADERSEIADRVYKNVMEWMQEYQQVRKTKAMAICIDWDAPTASGFRVHSAFGSYTAEQSGASIFPGKLAQKAKYSCKKWRKSENIDCTCQKLDNSGKNVLKVPASALD